jgi:hypothetical protein
MAFQPTPMDISIIITNAALAKSEGSEPRFLTERRITPTWTVMQVKAKLETMTGIPPGSQRLRVKVPGRPDQWADSDDRLIGDYGLVKGTEIEVGSLSFPFYPRFLLRCSDLCGLRKICSGSNLYRTSKNQDCQKNPVFMLNHLPGQRQSSSDYAGQFHRLVQC